MSKKDTQHSVGKIITTPQERDAIHIAVAPMVATELLSPGQHVGLTHDGAAGFSNDPVGVVDPFLKTVVRKGQKFWLFLYPNTITSLRHEWVHPAFTVSKASESEQWLRNFADEWSMDYGRMIEGATSGTDIIAGTDLHGAGELGRDHDLFWQHLEVVTGRAFTDEHVAKTGWGCSC